MALATLCNAQATAMPLGARLGLCSDDDAEEPMSGACARTRCSPESRLTNQETEGLCALVDTNLPSQLIAFPKAEA